MHVGWNVLHAARWKYRTQKIAILAPSHNFVGLYLRSWGMYWQSEKNLLNTDTSSTCSHNMANFGLLTAEICWQVWGTPANFNDFRVLAALLHGTLVVGVSQTLQRWTEGTTYIWQGDHHVGHWPHSSYCYCYLSPFPQTDIIGAMVIVWRVRGKIITSVLCNIVCNNCAQCNAHMWTDLTVLWIGFCLTGPISLCLGSFLYCVSLYIACMRRFVTWWGGPGGIEACP